MKWMTVVKAKGKTDVVIVSSWGTTRIVVRIIRGLFVPLVAFNITLDVIFFCQIFTILITNLHCLIMGQVLFRMEAGPSAPRLLYHREAHRSYGIATGQV